jgi:hypothetical protein
MLGYFVNQADNPGTKGATANPAEAARAPVRRLQNHQSLRRSIPDGGERNAGIKSNQPSFMLNGESKQINVGQLPRSMNSGRIHDFRVQHTDFIRPEFVDILVTGVG